MFPLTLTHLRFTVEALTPLRLGGYQAGSQLRGALGNVMRRAYCAGDAGDPAHAAACPVCWLLAAHEHPGQERRGYALAPPLGLPETVTPGARFVFGLTLFGAAQQSLPYFVLAVPEMGRNGVGAHDRAAGGRGQFALRQLHAADPLAGEAQLLLDEGENQVRLPTLTIDRLCVEAAARQMAAALASEPRPRLALHFLTPTRLIHDEQLLKLPDFGVVFARLLKRLDELNEQFAGGERRPLDEVQALQALADRVRLVEAGTRWVELWSGSTRTGRATPLGGFVGRAVYSAAPDTWAPLLPWLIWGQATQLGKDVVKGNGWYEIGVPGQRRYSGWLAPTPAHWARHEVGHGHHSTPDR